MKIKRVILMAAAFAVLSCKSGNGSDVVAESDQQQSITNEVIETIMSRRSIRAYKSEPVSRDTVNVILQCGINAPNAMNRQSWEVRVMDSKTEIDAVTRAFVAKNPEMGKTPGFVNMFRNAPTVVFVARDTTSAMSAIDCGLLGENIMLSAWSLGIGSCCLGGPVRFINSPDGEFFLNRLRLSPGYELTFAIALGYPDESPKARPRDNSKIKFVD